MMESDALITEEHEIVLSPSSEDIGHPQEVARRAHRTASRAPAGAADPSFYRSQEALLDSSATADMQMVDPECNAVLDTMETCVGIVEGVDQQHAYEEELVQRAHHEHHQSPSVADQHGLTAAEVALIRLQIMEEQDRKNERSAGTSPLPDLDILNICGNEDDMTDAKVATHFKVHPPKAQSAPAAAAAVETVTTMTSTDAASRSVSPIAVNGSDNSPLICSICFEEVGSISPNVSSTCASSFTDKPRGVTFASLPCCGSGGREETSTTKVCTVCILLLTQPTSDGSARIGRCPRCRSWIAVQTSSSPHAGSIVPSLTISAVESAGQCVICNQVKAHLVENHNVCDACFLGRRLPLLYECEQCHGVQRIPHPMYRYQPSVTEFGQVTWACQGACQNFTKWRIVTSQVRLIPSGDAPEEWGEDYLQLARARVMEARRGLANENNNNCNTDEYGGGWSSSCAIQ